MPSLADSAVKLFHRLISSSSEGQPLQHAGIETVLDGNTAVAVTEACIAEAAGLGATFPAESATLTWKAEQQRKGTNCAGMVLSSWEAEGPRGALAAAIGQTMAGVRATVFLSAPDLAQAQDLLVMAAGRHLPLVIHMDNRALATHSTPLGSGHEVCHFVADTGCIVLIAANVQEAVDLTLVARRVAESILTPVLVVMDAEQTALAAQEVYLPPPKVVQDYLGQPDDVISIETTAQRLLFGDTRRRIPRWHDLDRPVLHGALQGPESWALGMAAKQPYFEQQLQDVLSDAFSSLAQQVGTRLGPISTHALEQASIVLVAQGAAVETLQAVADHVHQAHNLNIGVLGIRCLRPLATSQIAEQLKGKAVVAVLERLNAPLSGDPPLLRELRAALGSNQTPRLRSVAYGLGGLALRAADLTALCLDLENQTNRQGAAHTTYLGLEFSPASNSYPKRQVLLDALRRDYPQIDELGIKSNDPSPDLRPGNATTVAIHRISGQGGRGLGMDAAAFLHQLMGGRVRSHPGLFWSRYESYCVDRFTNAPDNNGAPLRDPGDETPVDLAILTAPRYHRLFKPLTGLRKDGALLCSSALDDEALWKSLPTGLRDGLPRLNVRLYCLAPHETVKDEPDLAKEQLLGGMVAVLIDNKTLEQTPRKVIAQRETTLKNLNETARDSHLSAFSAGIGEVRKIDYEQLSAAPDQAEQTRGDDVPLAVRRLGRVDDQYDSLPRFWDQVGVLYQHGESAELTPDPYMATGTIPPLSSSFRDLSDSRDILPTFEPQACSGCGLCWTHCPDTAIGVTALPAGDLLDTGIRLAGADDLRMAAGKLASRMNTLARKKTGGYNTLGEYAQEAFSWLQEKMPMDAKRKQSMEQAMQGLLEKTGSLAVALTEPFFADPDGNKKDSGEWLSLAINPDACKGCGLCIQLCESQGLSASPKQLDHESQSRAQWGMWEQLPDTSKATIDRVSDHPEVGPLPALLLSRSALQSVAGGDGAEAGSGERIAVRLALATAEHTRRPLLEGLIEEIDKTRRECVDLIRKTLTEALPTDDLDALAEGLDAVQAGQVQLTSLTQQVEAAAKSGGVDAARLRRLVATARQLGDLHQQLSTGIHGLGRAPLGLVIAPGSLSSWAGVFPNNPFQVPVAMDMSGDTPQLAAGLLEGQLREFTSGLALLRQARLELTQPQEAARSSAAAGPLSWHDLTPEEQQLCPPILLLGNDDSLGGRGLSALIWLLGSDWPVKIMVLSDLDLGLGAGGIIDTPTTSACNPKANLGLLGLAQRQAYVAQTSIAQPTHLLESIKEGLQFAGPALINVYAPSPERHGFAPSQAVEQAERATASRAFPLFRYDPECAGVFGSRIELEGNPDSDARWQEHDSLTPGDWARGQKRFAGHFTALDEDAPAPTPLAEFLELDTKKQQGKTPYVSVPRDDGDPVNYRVEQALVGVAQERLHSWRTLQELAGIVSPFTTQIEQRADEKIAASQQLELQQLKQEYETRIREIEADIAVRLQDRLMTLAGYQSTNN